MTAYNAATLVAEPFYLFLFQKQLYGIVADELKVLYHAHMIFRAIALIQRLQSFTGKNFTFIAETDLSLRKQLALIAHVDAILPPRDTAGTVLFVKSLPFQVVFHRLITDAQTAIHTAWSD